MILLIGLSDTPRISAATPMVNPHLGLNMMVYSKLIILSSQITHHLKRSFKYYIKKKNSP
jgi:hypothetical protein